MRFRGIVFAAFAAMPAIAWGQGVIPTNNAAIFSAQPVLHKNTNVPNLLSSQNGSTYYAEDFGAIGDGNNHPLDGIILTLSPGAGYASVPTVSFSANASGQAATGTAVVSFQVTGTTVTAGGSGYTSAPVVTPSQPNLPDGQVPILQAVISGGAVTGVNVLQAGSGYTSSPTLTFSGGGGTGAAATSTIGNGFLWSVNVTSAPAYSSAPTVTLSGGTPTTAATVTAGLTSPVNVFWQNGTQINTSGWTLAQWQSIFPGAASLSNEIDLLAFENMETLGSSSNYSGMSGRSTSSYVFDQTFKLSNGYAFFTLPHAQISYYGDGTSVVIENGGGNNSKNEIFKISDSNGGNGILFSGTVGINNIEYITGTANTGYGAAVTSTSGQIALLQLNIFNISNFKQAIYINANGMNNILQGLTINSNFLISNQYGIYFDGAYDLSTSDYIGANVYNILSIDNNQISSSYNVWVRPGANFGNNNNLFIKEFAGGYTTGFSNYTSSPFSTSEIASGYGLVKINAGDDTENRYVAASTGAALSQIGDVAQARWLIADAGNYYWGIYNDNQISGSFTGTPFSGIPTAIGPNSETYYAHVLFDNVGGIHTPTGSNSVLNGIAVGVTPSVATLATNPPVSGTAYQWNGPGTLQLACPITYSPTSTAAATSTLDIGSTSTPSSAVDTESEPAGITAGMIHTAHAEVPSGWYYELTATNATIGTCVGVVH